MGKLLAGRLCEILELTSKGFTDRAIGDRLSISPDTVEAHWKRLRKIFDSSSRTQIVATAIRLGLISKELESTELPKALAEIRDSLADGHAKLVRSQITSMVNDQKRQRYLERLERGLSGTRVFAYSGELLGTWQKYWLTDNAEEYFGVVKQDFLTKPEFIPEWCNLDDLALVHGAVLEIERRRARGFQCEYRMTNLEGREFWLRDHASIFWSSDALGTHHYVGILVDITDLKEAAGQTTPNPVIIFD